jgi:hypothetical protein
METIIDGTYIFLSPLSNSLSEVETTRADNIRMEIKAFKSTVRKTVSPLSVTVIVKILRFNSNNAFPLFANGINKEADSGNKKSKKVLLSRIKKPGLNINIIKIPKIKYNSNV